MASSHPTTSTTDTAFEVLAHRDRRSVLKELVHSDGTATIDQLVKRILADPASGAGVISTQHDVRILLYHLHLPKLQAEGFVEFDSLDEPVRYTGNDRLETLLRRLP